MTYIGDWAFSGCTNLSSVTILNSTTEIGTNTFSGTAWYDNQPDGVIYLGKVAYKYKGTMPENTAIVLKEGTQKIQDNLFYGCTGLTSISIPNTVAEIGVYAFYQCSGLTSIDIPTSVTKIGTYAFAGCTGLTSVLIPSSLTVISSGLFAFCRSLTSMNIPNGVTTISSTAFSGCSGLTSVFIPSSVTSIGGSTFYGCSNLDRVEYGSIEGLCEILFADEYSNPLRYAKHLYIDGREVADVVIPSSVKSIGDYAFNHFSGLSSVTIGSGVKSIGEYSFYGCSNLSSVIVENPQPASIDYYSFNNQKNITLYVPTGTKEAYQAANYWKEFSLIIERNDDRRIGDLNGDGKITIADVTKLVNMILGKE